MERLLCQTKFNLAVVEECLMQREKRLGIECAHDELELALCKVVKTYLEKRLGIECAHYELELALCNVINT